MSKFKEVKRKITKESVDLQNKFMSTLDDRLKADLIIVLLQGIQTSKLYAGAEDNIKEALQCMKHIIIAREKNVK